MPIADRHARPLQQGAGRRADGRQDLVGPVRQFQGQERRRAFEASQELDEILHDSIAHAKQRLQTASPPAESQEDRLIDRIVAAQASLRP